MTSIPIPFLCGVSPPPPLPGVQVNSVLKSLLHAFTHTQNTPVESDDEDIKPKFYQELSINHFFVIFVGKKKNLKTLAKFHSVSMA